MSEQAPVTHRTGIINVPGTINAAVYRSLKRYIVPPVWKLVLIAFAVIYDGWLLYQLIASKNLGYIVFIILFTAAMVLVYFYNQNSMVKRIIRSRSELQQQGFDVMICFSQNTIVLYNHTTGSERTLKYTDLVSTVETDRCIAYYTNKSKYLMVPKDKMDDQLREKLLTFMQQKCPNLKKRW